MKTATIGVLPTASRFIPRPILRPSQHETASGQGGIGASGTNGGSGGIGPTAGGGGAGGSTQVGDARVAGGTGSQSAATPSPVVGTISGGNVIVAPNNQAPVTQNNYGQQPFELNDGIMQGFRNALLAKGITAIDVVPVGGNPKSQEMAEQLSAYLSQSGVQATVRGHIGVMAGMYRPIMVYENQPKTDFPTGTIVAIDADKTTN